MPYKQAGLTEKQAALHLLNRFTFGPRPGDVDKLVYMGLENWLEQRDVPVTTDFRAVFAKVLRAIWEYNKCRKFSQIIPNLKE